MIRRLLSALRTALDTLGVLIGCGALLLAVAYVNACLWGRC